MTTNYRVKGTTEDVTRCELCGKEDLRKTVVLAVLDADGNEEQVAYYGTDCAAKVTGRRAARIAMEAAEADSSRARQVAWAREVLAVYGPLEHESAWEKARVFIGRNPELFGRVNGADEVDRLLREARAVLAA